MFIKESQQLDIVFFLLNKAENNNFLDFAQRHACLLEVS